MRVACLDLPAFPLQLVWRQEPAWRALPVVVIDHDRPSGEVLWACERARQAGVLAGQRYAYALTLCPGLRARMVAPAQITAAIDELRGVLHRFSPRVEPGGPGTFWLDGDGLARVFREASDHDGQAGGAWGKLIAHALAGLGYRGAVVVGFSRFASYAIARAQRSAAVAVSVLRTAGDERAQASAVALARLDLALRDALAKLGVTTVGELVRLPAGGLLERFGREAHHLHQLAAGEAWDPVVAVAAPQADDERVVLDDDEVDIARMLFFATPAIERQLARLARRGRALTALHVELALKHAVGRIDLRVDTLQPAEPTLDGALLIRLLHLRLTGVPPEAPINALRVWCDDAPATGDQLALFKHKPRRDLAAVEQTVARLRAELGDDAVVRPVVRDAHLPEARLSWERVHRVVAARPTRCPVRPRIRRIFARPRRLPLQVRGKRDDGWLLAGLEQGAVTRIRGPYIVSGGWWSGAGEVSREYHFADLKNGNRLWVFFDRRRRRWFWHGTFD
jgi:protein ImuB